MQTVKQYLERQGRKFPEPDSEDGMSTSLGAYEDAGLPMVVACKTCTMTFALTANRLCDEDGFIYCSAECAGIEDDVAETWPAEDYASRFDAKCRG